MTDDFQGDDSVLVKLFNHNAWANLLLLESCAGLTDAQLDAAAVGGYGSIRDTLTHLLVAEQNYVNQVNGRLPAVPLQKGQWPGFVTATAAAQWSSAELLQIARTARADTVHRVPPPRPAVEYKLSTLIVQAITHSTEHRTQIATILTTLGVEPPDLSGWHYMEVLGEITDF
jgi:uncharacterized damage-inducible protein DinB